MNVIAGATAAGGKGWAGSLAAAMQSLAGLIGAAQDDGRTPAAALASLTGVRGLASELERSELALIEAARGSGATWSQIAVAMGASRRQTAQNATPTCPAATCVHQKWTRPIQRRRPRPRGAPWRASPHTQITSGPCQALAAPLPQPAPPRPPGETGARPPQPGPSAPPGDA
jgi:hypothetical protein